MRTLVLAFGLALAATFASAQTQPWPERTAGDVEAAYHLILENHPGVLPELGDVAFQKTLADAHANGLRAANSVSNFMGYVHVMRVFANAFDDPSMEWAPSPEMERYALTPATPGIGEAGLSFEQKNGAFWIGLQSFVRAPHFVPEIVLAAMDEQAPALRVAKRVVIDLRGNSNPPDVDQGDRVLLTIFSPENVAKTKRWAPPVGCITMVTNRASPANLQARLARMGPAPVVILGGAPGAPFDPRRSARVEVDKMSSAIAGGKSFTDPFEPACIPGNPVEAKPAQRGRVIVITDYGCTLGCLRTLARARALGAVHVGQKTRSSNWYLNNLGWKEKLPSGLGTFQIERGVGFNVERSLGPFEPTYRFDGDISDTAAVKAWVAGLKF